MDLHPFFSEELAMRLQEEELSQLQPQSTQSPQRRPIDSTVIHVNDPSPRLGPPPTTKEEYEHVAQAQTRREKLSVRYQHIHIHC